MKRRGFSLIEITLATTIAIIMLSAIFTFYIFGLKSSFKSTNLLAQSDSIRNLTGRIVEDVRTAEADLVAVFTDTTASSLNDQIANDGAMLLLAYKDWRWDDSDADPGEHERIEEYDRIVIYYRDGTTIYRREETFTPVRSSTAIPFPDASSYGPAAGHQIVARDVQVDDVDVFDKQYKGVLIDATFLTEGQLGTTALTLYNFQITSRG